MAPSYDACILSVFVNGIRMSDGFPGASTPGGRTCFAGLSSTIFLNAGAIIEFYALETSLTPGSMFVSQMIISVN